MARPFAVEVFSETDVEHPVELVSDSPGLPDEAVQARVLLIAVDLNFALQNAPCCRSAQGLVRLIHAGSNSMSAPVYSCAKRRRR